MSLSQIITGECRDVMRSALAEPDSIDAIVTDPPYGLSFMGREWDHSVPGVEFWSEMLRLAKPGAHLLAFGGTRTFHRMMCAIEDAGWEIRDTLMWVYGSGFPKSHNLRGDMEGWGTALKPAWEPIIMARKPLAGTVAANVRQHGTGALNIDGCRVSHVTVGDGNLALNPHLRSHINGGNGGHIIATEKERRVVTPNVIGRWPANLIHDGSDEVLAAFPDAPGQQGKVRGDEPTGNGFSGAVMSGGFTGRRESAKPRLDSGSAARFFYCAKASKRDRDEGLEGFELVKVKTKAGGGKPNEGRSASSDGGIRANTHPTVKPTDLMRWLVRLVTPPGGTVLDPFCGSGSTGKAAVLEWRNFIGIDLDPAYTSIAAARIEHARRKAA